VVGPRSDGPYAIAIDITVGRIMFGAVGLTGDILTRREVVLGRDDRSPTDAAEMIAAECVNLIGNLGPDAQPVGVGVSVPGTVDRTGYDIRFAPDLGWRRIPFASLIVESLCRRIAHRLPVKLGNHAHLGLRAEHMWGAARGCDDVVYLTRQTTVGAGVLMNGQPVSGHLGSAGAIGHLVLDPGGPLCGCGKRGCVDSYLGQPAWIADRQLPAIAEPLARTIAMLVNVLNPQRVLLGGSLARVLELDRARLEATLRHCVFGAFYGTPQLCAASLGDDSPMLGAAALAFQRLLADPTLDLRALGESTLPGPGTGSVAPP